MAISIKKRFSESFKKKFSETKSKTSLIAYIKYALKFYSYENQGSLDDGTEKRKISLFNNSLV